MQNFIQQNVDLLIVSPNEPDPLILSFRNRRDRLPLLDQQREVVAGATNFSC